MSEIKFKSLAQFRMFAGAIEEIEWDDKVTIEQRSKSGPIVVGNRKYEIEIDTKGIRVKR